MHIIINLHNLKSLISQRNKVIKNEKRLELQPYMGELSLTEYVGRGRETVGQQNPPTSGKKILCIRDTKKQFYSPSHPPPGGLYK